MVRFKNRYFLIHVKTEKSKAHKLTQQEVALNFKKDVQKYYGDFGAASIGNFGVKYFNEKHKLLVVRVFKGPHRFLASIIPLLAKSGNDQVNYSILYTGATIRQCKRHIVTYQNNFIQQTSSNVSREVWRQLDKNNYLLNSRC